MFAVQQATGKSGLFTHTIVCYASLRQGMANNGENMKHLLKQ